VRQETPDSALYLVTAAHVLESGKDGPATVLLREPHPDGSYGGRLHTVALSHEGKRLWERHAEQDVAVLRLTDPFPVAVAALPFSALVDGAGFEAAGLHLCSSVFVLTYPTDFDVRRGFAVARQATIACYPLLPVERYPTYGASFTTFTGDSGGPVFVCGTNERPLVVGVVVGAFQKDESMSSGSEEKTIHRPYGLGLVVHAQLVRELIERAAKQATNCSSDKVQSLNKPMKPTPR
jgi:hypothetical protein